MDTQQGSGPASRPQADERGSVLVEFSFVFGLFVFLLYALISFGMILAAKNSLAHAAAEGARAAVGVVDDPATPTDERADRARAQVGRSLSWFGAKYQPSDTTATVASCNGAVPASPPMCITVAIGYPYDSRPIVPPAPGLGLVTPSTLTSTAVVELGG